MAYYKKLVTFGYGGIKCPCCTPFGSVKKNRKYANKKALSFAENLLSLKDER